MKGQLRLLALALPQALTGCPAMLHWPNKHSKHVHTLQYIERCPIPTYVQTDYSNVMGILYVYGWTLSIRTSRGIVHLCCTCEYF